MKLYSYADGPEIRVAVAVGDEQLVDLTAASGASRQFATMISLIEGGTAALDAVREIAENPPTQALRSLAEVQIVAPIPNPPKIRGFSVFERHGRQAIDGIARRLSASAPDPEAAYQGFLAAMKFPAGWSALPGYYYMDHSTVCGSGTEVRWPPYSNWIDFELEIGAVIGVPGKDIARDAAGQHIFGYTIVNDLSARDAQLEAMGTGLGPAKGKDFDNSNVIGPCIVTADEIADPYALAAEISVNGEVWSRADGSEAQFRFDQCIEYASRSQTLAAGEIFTTGTLPSCSSIEIDRTLRPGDEIEFRVEKMGTLKTVISNRR